jgi:hypothetical protein
MVLPKLRTKPAHHGQIPYGIALAELWGNPPLQVSTANRRWTSAFMRPFGFGDPISRIARALAAALQNSRLSRKASPQQSKTFNKTSQ